MGMKANSYDLLLQGGKGLSVNSELTGNNPVTIKNLQGDREVSPSEWNTTTNFVLSVVGIVYADPSKVDKSDFEGGRKDALISGRKFLDSQSTNHKWVISVDIPYKPPDSELEKSKVASMSIASEIIEKNKLTNLQNYAD